MSEQRVKRLGIRGFFAASAECRSKQLVMAVL